MCSLKYKVHCNWLRNRAIETRSDGSFTGTEIATNICGIRKLNVMYKRFTFNAGCFGNIIL